MVRGAKQKEFSMPQRCWRISLFFSTSLIAHESIVASTSPMRTHELAARQKEVSVWKSPQCGCCNDWIRYLESSGSRIVVHDVGNVTTRPSLDLPRRYASCHTATYWVTRYGWGQPIKAGRKSSMHYWYRLTVRQRFLQAMAW
jgi:hypothetical protein